jgi:ribulose bisphosphate carboxylase small subunit
MKHRVTVEYLEDGRSRRENWIKAGWSIDDIDHNQVAQSLAAAQADAEQRLGESSNEAGFLRWLQSVMAE